LGEIILQLVKNDFSGVINVGSSEPCTKYEFGIHLAQKFKYDLSLINQGSVEEHSSMVKRAKDLTMDTDKITELDIAVPAFSRSIESFSQDCPYN
jgi:dTDP-4-dehydrorhamnose reductase